MKRAVRIISSIFIVISFPVWAQGNLEPSGPPAPVMKTLDQVEARIPVSAGGTLSEPGSYYLTDNLSERVIISADNVTLDLNGFTIDVEPSGGFAGIHLLNTSRTKIFNGTIIGGLNSAIVGESVNLVLVADVAMSNNGVCINFPTPSGVIEILRVHCDTSENEQLRVYAVEDQELFVTVRDSTFINSNTSEEEDRAAINIFHSGTGLLHAIVSNNRVYSNRQGGIRVSAEDGPSTGSVTDNQAYDNGAIGIQVVGDFVVARNMAHRNAENYGLSLAPNAAPVLGLGDGPTAWNNISE